MDIESRLQKIEAQVHQIRTLVWIVLALVLAIGLGFLLVAIRLGLLPVDTFVMGVWLNPVVSFLIGAACLVAFGLLASVLSGLRRFRSSREVDAQIFREAIAERAKALRQDPDR